MSPKGTNTEKSAGRYKHTVETLQQLITELFLELSTY